MMYPDPHDFWVAGCTTFKKAKLEDSYNYPTWRRDILAHLKLFEADSALDRSKDMQRRRQEAEKTTVSEAQDGPTNAAEQTSGYADPSGDDSEDEELAQAIIWLCLSDYLHLDIDYEGRSAAVLWDHLYERYGTPDSHDINMAHRALFPRTSWEEWEDIPGNIRKQQNAAMVLNAAGVPVSDILVRVSHLKYLPSSFYQDYTIRALAAENPGELDTHRIYSAVHRHIEDFPRTDRTDRCYYHDTNSQRVSQCRNIRSLMKRVRKREGKSAGNKVAGDKALDDIFDGDSSRA